MHDLYGGVREKWPHLSEKYFRLSNGTKEISPDYGHLQLDDWELELHDRSNIVVTFPTSELQGWYICTHYHIIVAAIMLYAYAWL